MNLQQNLDGYCQPALEGKNFILTEVMGPSSTSIILGGLWGSTRHWRVQELDRFPTGAVNAIDARSS